MKVLFSHGLPFFLSHGGVQTFVESLMRELPALGVEVEPERWWDETQRGEIIHFVGRPNAIYIDLAKERGFKIVMTEFLDQTASRGKLALFAQRTAIQLGRKILGPLTARLAWDAYDKVHAMTYAVPHELETAVYLFGAQPTRGHVIPHGLEADAIENLSQAAEQSDYLISVATITSRKNTHLLAAAAKLAKVPVLFVGKPYSEDDPYFLSFREMVDNEYVRYAGFVTSEEKYDLLKRARGFALLSQFESGCFAIFEAAAAGLPLFLSNLPWATKPFRDAKESKFVTLDTPDRIGRQLAAFYSNAHRLSETTFPIFSSREIARRYLAIYEKILAEK